MGFRNIELQKVYDTRNPLDNPVENFYIPVLRQAVSYDRGTGYFSSTVLSLAARGIAGLIRNEGKMRIITSPQLTPEDAQVLTRLSTGQEIDAFLEEKMALALDDFDEISSLMEKDHLRALAWMLTEGLLEIRLVVPRGSSSPNGMFHFKIGIMQDSEGNIVSFSGSNNESVAGWVRNIEQIKVFSSWDQGQIEYLRGDQQMFDRYWENSEATESLTVQLPGAIRDALLEIAPSDAHELEEILSRLEQSSPTLSDRRELRSYQEEAVRLWSENGQRGVLEMATGTGKTLTASRCIDVVMENGRMPVVLVVAPLIFLVNQWAGELRHLNPVLVSGGTDWRSELKALKNEIQLGLRDSLVLIAVQNTASSEDFINLVLPILKLADKKLIVADEVHGVGAEQFSELMIDEFEFRLGLSATPNRWFDDEGTQRIMSYFGGVIYSFGIHQALNWIDPKTGQTPLCPYNYFPTFVELTDEEKEEFELLSDQIKSAVGKGQSPESSDFLRRLLIKRARVVKRAKNKISTLREILQEFENFYGTLVYCSDKAQLAEAAHVLDSLGITYRRFSGDEGAFPKKELGGKSERDVIMADFESGSVEVLLAMKCLDEGVDIPSARRGVILASSTNPREFIQRRGRLLRRAPGKKISEIYDVLVVPAHGVVGDSSEMNLLAKELKRVEEFAQDAVNEVEIRDVIMEKTWQVLK